MSTHVPPALAEVMRRQRALVTDRQLLDASISSWTRRRWERDGLLVRVHPGVLRSAFVAPDLRTRCLAATLAVGDLVICGPTAGRLLRLRRMPVDDVHAMVPRHGVRLDGVVVHASTALAAGDHQTIDGIRVLRPARLAPDLARYLSDADLESVIEQMLDRGLTSLPALFAMARRLRARGRDGMHRFVRVLNARPGWQRPAGSEIELRFVGELERRGVVLRRQHRIDLGGGGFVVVDAAVPDVRVAIEVDHVTWHGGRVESQADKLRDRRLLRLGWTTVRVTDDDVRQRLHQAVDEVETIIGRLRTAA